MRIIYVTSTLPYGPGEPFVIPEVRELARRGHDLLIVPMNPAGQIVHEDAAHIMDWCLPRSLASPAVLAGAAAAGAKFPIGCVGLVRDVLRSRTRAIAAKNLAVIPKGLWLGRVARRWKADHIHAHWAACTSTIAYVASKTSTIPWSFTAHRWDIGEDNLLALKGRSASFMRAINKNGVCTLGEAVGDDRLVPVMIHMGIELPAKKLRTAREGRLRLLMAANLVEVKGHQYLIEAMVRLNREGVDVALDLAGDGELRGQLEKQVTAAKIQDRVRFLGQISHPELLRRMDEPEWDCVVLSSIVTADGDHEGTPVTLMEAMGRGIPVISTLTGGIPELLGDGAGVLVPDKDAAALANAIAQVAADPPLRMRLSAAGRQRVEEEYAVEAVVDRLESQFRLACRKQTP